VTVTALPEAHVDARQRDERQRAVRALLARPLLCAEDAGETLGLVRRHRDWLAERFAHLLGYRLTVRAEHARLHKRPPAVYRDRPARVKPQALRPGPEDGWAPFTRRHYVLLALTLAVLEAHQGRHQALIGALADEVAALGAELGSRVDFERRDERRAFAEVLDFLGRHGVLRQRDGSTGGFVGRDEAVEEALFDVEHGRLGDLKGTPVALTDVTEPGEILAAHDDYSPTEEGERARRRHSIARRLVEDPVLYVEDLAPAERDTYRSQRHRLERELEELTGLQAERRAEGSALVDPERRLSDVRFPTRALESQLALVLCERLRSLVHEGARNPLPRSEVEHELAGLRERFGLRDAGALDAAALELLERHDLIRPEGARLRVMPALARFSRPTLRAAHEEAA